MIPLIFLHRVQATCALQLAFIFYKQQHLASLSSLAWLCQVLAVSKLLSCHHLFCQWQYKPVFQLLHGLIQNPQKCGVVPPNTAATEFVTKFADCNFCNTFFTIWWIWNSKILPDIAWVWRAFCPFDGFLRPVLVVSAKPSGPATAAIWRVAKWAVTGYSLESTKNC